MAFSPRSGAAIGFDAITVGIDHEGGVVFGAVVRSGARLAVIATARTQSGLVEGIDALARLAGEAEMEARFVVRRYRPLGRADPQLDAIAPVAERAGALAQALVTERLQGR